MAIPQRYGKRAILDLWDSIEQGPIRLTPIDTDHVGSSYDQDSIRITGSQEFINSVLGNLKGLLEYDGNGSRLEVMYTQTVTRSKDESGKIVAGDLTGAWAAYVKAKSRGTGSPGRRKGSSNQAAKEPREPKPEKTKNPLREVNAGLSLKAKPKVEPESKPTTPVYVDPLYAIASSFRDEDGKIDPVWLEPIDHPILPCETYEDVISADNAIDAILKNNKAIKRKNFQIVEIIFDKSGKIKFDEV